AKTGRTGDGRLRGRAHGPSLAARSIAPGGRVRVGGEQGAVAAAGRCCDGPVAIRRHSANRHRAFGAGARRMKNPRSRMDSGEAGFTLIEALAATVLMGIIVGALAIVSAQWLPNWSRGFTRVQRIELVDIALHR